MFFVKNFSPLGGGKGRLPFPTPSTLPKLSETLSTRALIPKAEAAPGSPRQPQAAPGSPRQPQAAQKAAPGSPKSNEKHQKSMKTIHISTTPQSIKKH